jgi:hypothetical protein
MNDYAVLTKDLNGSIRGSSVAYKAEVRTLCGFSPTGSMLFFI